MANIPDIERIGVSKLDTLFSEAGWKFREQPIKDYGVDAQVEIVNEDNPTGKLIAIQIKSGLSYFSEQNETSIVFRPKTRHVSYWIDYCLPVILVLYHPDNDTFNWVRVDESSLMSTKKGYKILIPRAQYLDKQTIKCLVDLFDVPLYERKLHRFILEAQWMKLIQDGADVYARCFDWVNKLLPRTEISLWYSDGNEDIRIDVPTTYCPGLSSLAILQQTFPWAEFIVDVDDDAREEYLTEQYEAECYGWHDKENDSVYYTESYSEWVKDYDLPSIVPYMDHGGEALEYRFRLELNELGKAILIVLDAIYERTHLDRHGFRF